MTTTQRIRSSQRIATRIVFLGTVLWSVYSPLQVSAQRRSIGMTVLVFNYTAVSPSTLKNAEHMASMIFREAGLQVLWLSCPVPPTRDSDESCAPEAGLQEFHLRIVNSPERNYFGEGIFGFTVAPVIATVYYGHALSLAKRDGSDYEVPVILGCVMAHEIGHLLLGPGAHAPVGIMQPQWNREHLERAMKGHLLFTAEEAEKMRSNAASRVARLTGMAKRDFVGSRTAPE